jgi:hypothetical protein
VYTSCDAQWPGTSQGDTLRANSDLVSYPRLVSAVHIRREDLPPAVLIEDQRAPIKGCTRAMRLAHETRATRRKVSRAISMNLA